MLVTLDLSTELEHKLQRQAELQNTPLNHFIETILTKTVNLERVELMRRLGNHATINEAIHKAFEFYVQYLQQQEILAEFGMIEYADDYDYKRQRSVA
ncbi:hypothetical protein QUF63_01275 [Anaerolineales bacterium HSG25]|nr:hypothetical protein [Anaerolineales bacterium HSG25]